MFCLTAAYDHLTNEVRDDPGQHKMIIEIAAMVSLCFSPRAARHENFYVTSVRVVFRTMTVKEEG